MDTFTILGLINLQPEGPNAMDLRCACGRSGLLRTIGTSEINRPGMALAGFFDHLSGNRIQVIGRGEWAYIDKMPEAELRPHLEHLLSFDIPCFIFCSGLYPPAVFRNEAEKVGIPVLVTPLNSGDLSIRLLRALDEVFAPQTIIHGVLMEVEGMGVLIRGESGVGKSESALELLDRGHRLVADDAVLVKRLYGDSLWGSRPPQTTSDYTLEIRGLGILNVAQFYGINSIKNNKSVELIVQLEEWSSSRNYARIGVADDTTTLLEVNLPVVTIPVKHGRNIPIIIEAAVLNQRVRQQNIHNTKRSNDTHLPSMNLNQYLAHGAPLVGEAK